MYINSLNSLKTVKNEFLLFIYYMQAYDNNSELIHCKAITHVFILLPRFFIHNLHHKYSNHRLYFP